MKKKIVAWLKMKDTRMALSALAAAVLAGYDRSIDIASTTDKIAGGLLLLTNLFGLLNVGQEKK